MPYTKQDLQNLYNLSGDEVSQTLTVAGLNSEQESYSDEEIQSGFDVIRSYFNSGQASDYDMAAELFQQQTSVSHQPEVESQTKTKRAANTKKMKNSEENDVDKSERLNILELIALASKQVTTRISLTEAVQILNICGLPDQEEYTSLERDRFLEACKLIKQQNKSYEEVAKHFGIDSSTSKADAEDLQQHLVEQIGGSAVAMDEDLLRLVNKITAKQASGTNIRELVRQAYLINLSRQLTDNQDGTDTFFAEVEERVMAQIEGKSRARSLKANWEWAQNSLTPLSPKQMSLPQDLDNGTSGD